MPWGRWCALSGTVDRGLQIGVQARGQLCESPAARQPARCTCSVASLWGEGALDMRGRPPAQQVATQRASTLGRRVTCDHCARPGEGRCDLWPPVMHVPWGGKV